MTETLRWPDSECRKCYQYVSYHELFNDAFCDECIYGFAVSEFIFSLTRAESMEVSIGTSSDTRRGGETRKTYILEFTISGRFNVLKRLCKVWLSASSEQFSVVSYQR